MKSNTKPKGISYSKYGWMFISVPVLFFIVFTLYPAIESLKMSFQTFKDGVYVFSGLSNIAKMFGDQLFLKALLNTFLFMIIQIPIMMILALFLATLLNSKSLRLRSFFRTSIFIPCVTSLVAYSLLFKMLFANQGLINYVLVQTGMMSNAIQWLDNPFWARFVIVLALTWRWTGYNVIFYISAMQNIPEETYEAAQIDGASAFKTFWHITVPQLKPIILLTMIMSTNGTLQLFDEPMNITGGGPANATMTISQYIYNQSFVYSPNFPYAATLSYVIVIIMVILAIFQFKFVGGDD